MSVQVETCVPRRVAGHSWVGVFNTASVSYQGQSQTKSLLEAEKDTARRKVPGGLPGTWKGAQRSNHRVQGQSPTRTWWILLPQAPLPAAPWLSSSPSHNHPTPHPRKRVTRGPHLCPAAFLCVL